MNIIELIKKLIAYVPTENGIKTEYGENDVVLFTLDQVKEALKKYEKEKYPAEFFEYKHFSFPIEEDRVPFQVTYVKAIKPLHLSEEDTKNMAMHAYKVRQLSIIAGILYAMHTSQGLFLNLAQDKTIATLSTYIEAIYSPNLQEINIEKFISELAKKLTPDADVSDTLNEIRIAERYFVADYKKSQLLLNETTINDIRFFQLDTYFAKLSLDQKNEFLKIKQTPLPVWFTYLKKWEQLWLQAVIPDDLNGDWSHFESLSQSSAMSQIPGIQNARMNYLVKFHDEKYEVLADGFRTGTMVPYEMHVDKKEMFYHTEANALQVLGFLDRVVAEKNTKGLWGNLDLGGLKPIIFVQSLLSDVVVAAKEDRHLTKKQKLAVRTIALEDRFPNTTIMTGNDPLNGLRHIAALNGHLSKASGRWKYSDLLLNYAKEFIEMLSSQVLSPLQQKKLDLIKAAAANLKKLKSTSYPGRNFSAYKVAYSAIIAEKTGGIATLNCKSGKDRTGLEDLYILAMYIYFDLYNCLPEITDTGSKRENFVIIFTIIFNLLRAQALAANNTPGSFGLKLDPTMLCDDIEKSLETSGTYKPTISQANLNKPQDFIKLERQDGRKRADSTKELSKGSSPIMPPALSPASSSTALSTNIEVEDMKKELAKLHSSAALDSTRLKEALSAFDNFEQECLADPALIPHWQFEFKKFNKALTTLSEPLKEAIQKLHAEVQQYISENKAKYGEKITTHPTLLYLTKSLANDDLFLKCHGDINDVIETVQLKTLPAFRRQFDEARKEIEAIPNTLENKKSSASTALQPASPSEEKKKPSSFKISFWGSKKKGHIPITSAALPK